MKHTLSKLILDINESKSETSKGLISGYASVFGVLDEQGDRVIHGAFKNSLSQLKEKNRWPKMLWQHNPQEPIGQWTKIIEDEKGLYVEGSLLLDIQRGREAYALLKENVIDGLSIGYRVLEAHKSEVSNERLLTQVDLLEVSLVTFAANEKAIITNVKASQTLTHRLDRLACKMIASPQ